MQDLLLSLSRKDMKANMRKYEKKAPKPLNSLFQEKLAKSEAAKRRRRRVKHLSFHQVHLHRDPYLKYDSLKFSNCPVISSFLKSTIVIKQLRNT
jgi:hypothetical protein